jgi:hypothetical protein
MSVSDVVQAKVFASEDAGQRLVCRARSGGRGVRISGSRLIILTAGCCRDAIARRRSGIVNQSAAIDSEESARCS